MTEYNKIVRFGNVAFRAGNITVNRKSSTLKSKIGKIFVEKNIPMRDAMDIVISMKGIITGLSRSAGQTKSEAIENDRVSLIDLEDGDYHTYSDGRHSGNFAIQPGSLVWNDLANRMPGQPKEFNVTFVEWQ